MGEQRLVGGDDRLAGAAAPPGTAPAPGRRRRRSARPRGRPRDRRPAPCGSSYQRSPAEIDAAVAPAIARRDRDDLDPRGRRARRAARRCSRSRRTTPPPTVPRPASPMRSGSAIASGHRPGGARALRRRWRCEEGLDVAHRLADAVPVLDQGDAHIALAVLAEADAGRDRDLGLLEQQLGRTRASRARGTARASAPRRTWWRAARGPASPPRSGPRPARRAAPCSACGSPRRSPAGRSAPRWPRPGSA